MKKNMKMIVFCLLSGWFSTEDAVANFQMIDESQSDLADSTDTIDSGTNFLFTQQEFYRMGDYDLGKWFAHFPHSWISQVPQYGQPQVFQGIATPAWMSDIRWNNTPLVDPIYGNFDLQFLPVFSMDTVAVKGKKIEHVGNPIAQLAITSKKLQTLKPYTQVFYNAGDYDLNHVDILFMRGFSRQIQFKTGTNFFKYKGMYPNSNYDRFRINVEMTVPLSNKLNMMYTRSPKR